MDLKVLDCTWVTHAAGTLGIVVTENEEGERRLRAANCQGGNEEHDKKYIAEWGGSVAIPDLERMIALVKENPK